MLIAMVLLLMFLRGVRSEDDCLSVHTDVGRLRTELTQAEILLERCSGGAFPGRADPAASILDTTLHDENRRLRGINGALRARLRKYERGESILTTPLTSDRGLLSVESGTSLAAHRARASQNAIATSQFVLHGGNAQHRRR